MMNPIIFAIPIFLVTIVAEWAWSRHKGQTVYSLPDAIASLNMGILSQVVGLFAKVVSLAAYVAVYQQFALTTWAMNHVSLWVLALLLYDFFYYWNHRLGHEVSLLWGAHSIHHSSEYYNLSTALRQSATGVLFSWVFYLPMALLGVPPTMLVIVGLVDLLYQYWVHTELIGRLGWIDRVLVTPSNHRVHHGQNDYCIDKNYGGILVIWDRLFGTFTEERPDEKIVYGVRKPLHSLNPLWANTMHYADLWQQAHAAQGWGQKLKTIWGRPGGEKTTPTLSFDAATFVRYDTQTPTLWGIYCAVQYALLVPIFISFLLTFKALTPTQNGLYGLWLTLSLVAISALLERAPWAKLMELARWAGPLLLWWIWPHSVTPLLPSLG